jgi:CheY-like chemotaxis protein
MTAKVLWVEDSPDDVLLIGRAIRKAGLEPPALVRDGREAVEYLSGSGPYADRSMYPFPTLVLLDIKLPKVSGFEVLHWIREHEETSRLPVVMFTSSKERSDVDRAYALGANAYLLKSVDHEHLVETLTRVRAFWLDLNLNPSVPGHEVAASGQGPGSADEGRN